MNVKNRLLIIGYVWPEPHSSAAGSRMMQLITLFLEQGWEVTFASPAMDSPLMVDLEAIGVKKVAIQLNHSSFDRFVMLLQPDVVLFDRFMMEEQFGWRVVAQCPQALRILDTEDLHSLRYARQKAVKAQKPFDLAVFKNSDLAKREVASIFRCDITLMISEVEMGLLTREFGVPKVLLHHLMLLLEPIPESQVKAWPHFILREHFVTIGNFRHEPNWDAVLYLKQHIWPLVRKELPKAELHIYGAYTPPKATALHKPLEGFYIEGWVADVIPVMTQARVCLAPIRFGAGIKGKFTDAMRCGTPSVTTSIGAEAMSGTLPWAGKIANDPKAIADAAVTLYTNQIAWKTAQQNGISIINNLYNRDTLMGGFMEKMHSVIADLTSHRTHNFIGGMLLHHSMRSTEYMSRWITEKNANAKTKKSDVS